MKTCYVFSGNYVLFLIVMVDQQSRGPKEQCMKMRWILKLIPQGKVHPFLAFMMGMVGQLLQSNDNLRKQSQSLLFLLFHFTEMLLLTSMMTGFLRSPYGQHTRKNLPQV